MCKVLTEAPHSPASVKVLNDGIHIAHYTLICRDVNTYIYSDSFRLLSLHVPHLFTSGSHMAERMAATKAAVQPCAAAAKTLLPNRHEQA